MLHLMYGCNAVDAMARCQLVHDLRQCPVVVGSPQTEPQRQQVIRVIHYLKTLSTIHPYKNSQTAKTGEISGTSGRTGTIFTNVQYVQATTTDALFTAIAESSSSATLPTVISNSPSPEASLSTVEVTTPKTPIQSDPSTSIWSGLAPIASVPSVEPVPAATRCEVEQYSIQKNGTVPNNGMNITPAKPQHSTQPIVTATSVAPMSLNYTPSLTKLAIGTVPVSIEEESVPMIMSPIYTASSKKVLDPSTPLLSQISLPLDVEDSLDTLKAVCSDFTAPSNGYIPRDTEVPQDRQQPRGPARPPGDPPAAHSARGGKAACRMAESGHQTA